MRKLMKELKRRERAAYPPHMRQIEDCSTWSDLQEYCESGQVNVHLLGKTGYIIYTQSEVVDWVGDATTCFEAFRIIKNAFGNKPFGADFRASTSWPIMQVMERRGRIRLSNVSSWYWGSEEMFEATVTILR